MKKGFCCMGGDKAFPTFAVVILVLAILWILAETGVITAKIPWFPVILAVIAIGWIIDHYSKK